MLLGAGAVGVGVSLPPPAIVGEDGGLLGPTLAQRGVAILGLGDAVGAGTSSHLGITASGVVATGTPPRTLAATVDVLPPPGILGVGLGTILRLWLVLAIAQGRRRLLAVVRHHLGVA